MRKLRAERFDAAILFQNAFQAAWMAWCARIPVRIGYARDGRSSLLSEAVEAPLAGALMGIKFTITCNCYFVPG